MAAHQAPHPWDSPGKNTGVGCHFLLQCMKVKSEREVAQSCPTLSDAMDCSLPGSSIHGIFQARVLGWGAIAFSGILLKGSSKFTAKLRGRYRDFPETPRLQHPEPPHINIPHQMVHLTQLLHPRSPIMIPECLLCIRAPCRCVVHSVGLDKCIMTCIQFHCPEHPRAPPTYPPSPVHSVSM